MYVMYFCVVSCKVMSCFAMYSSNVQQWHAEARIDRICRAQDFMPTSFSVAPFLEFFRQGVATNWWGLACPSHGGPAAAPSLVLSFLAGLGFGIVFGIILMIFGISLQVPSGASILAAFFILLMVGVDQANLGLRIE